MDETDAVSVTAAWSIRQAGAADLAQWAALRQALWPDENPTRHVDDIHDILGKPGRAVAFLAIDRAGRALGFVEATLRTDYVNGTDSSPVGFLEGWYVVPEHRHGGAGRALVAAVERWTREQECTELASDTWLDNALGQQAHLACGFEEVERVVYFRKRLVE